MNALLKLGLCIVTGLVAATFCGCQSTAPVVNNVSVTSPPLPPPVLAPLPNYPAESTDWKTVTPLMLWPGTGRFALINAELCQALQRRGYTLVPPPDTDTAWLAAAQRRGTKAILLTTADGMGSRVFDGKQSTDICLQVLVIDQPYDGVNLTAAAPRIRTFHVWSRQTLPTNSNWDELYKLHSPTLAENLMRLPAFREALE